MPLFLVGMSHKTAPVEIRERLAFRAEELPPALAGLHREVGCGVILSTCNRTEVYLDLAGDGGVRAQVTGFLGGVKNVPIHDLEGRFYYLRRRPAVRHLFRVAAGVESMVIGEAEVLGQVRSAFVAATESGCSDPFLSRLFHSAIRVGRRARSETAIARSAVSVSSTAVQLARQTLGDLSPLKVLVVSAGEAGKLTAAALRDIGVAEIVVTSRTLERAQSLAVELGGRAVPFLRMADAVAECDIVISSTGAPSFLIGPEMVRAVMERRNGRPLLLIDIAVPRDVHPAVREIDSVHLYDIDDLQSVSRANLRARMKEIRPVEAMIEEEVDRFLDWARSLRAVPTVAAIRQQAEELRAAEVAKTLARLPNLSPAERERIEALSHALVKKLLHRPVARLKSREYGHLYVRAARELFGIDEAGAES